MRKQRLGARLTRRAILVTVFAIGLVAATVVGATAASENSTIALVRQATAQYHDLSAATGFAKFYICTDNEGVGAMGQHYVNGDNVGDGVIDPSKPDVLVYEPLRGGGQRLVAVEYVVIRAQWDASHATPPQLFGHTLKLVPAPNRYGLPDFYEIHVWAWKPNPRGMFDDWNPTVSCLGNGDPA